MRMSKVLKEAQDMVKITPKALALEIADLLNWYKAGGKINEHDRYLLGIAYSEFWADENDNYDNALIVASEKCNIVRKFLGLPDDFGYRVDGLFIGKDRFAEGWNYGNNKHS